MDAWEMLLEIETDRACDLLSRVTRGAALLDRVEPGWHRRIAVDQLAMETNDRDVLGQLHGDFRSGFREVLRTLPAWELFSAADHGFTLRDSEQPGDDDSGVAPEAWPRFAALTALWRRFVLGRQGEPEAIPDHVR